jgi:hypothetical protein
MKAILDRIALLSNCRKTWPRIGCQRWQPSKAAHLIIEPTKKLVIPSSGRFCYQTVEALYAQAMEDRWVSEVSFLHLRQAREERRYSDQAMVRTG